MILLIHPSQWYSYPYIPVKISKEVEFKKKIPFKIIIESFANLRINLMSGI